MLPKQMQVLLIPNAIVATLKDNYRNTIAHYTIQSDNTLPGILLLIIMSITSRIRKATFL